MSDVVREESPSPDEDGGDAPSRDERFMRLALEEARRVAWTSHPNPAVGAVVVRGENVIARGATQPVGFDHAEIDALNRLGGRAEGAEMYVSLEPCCHVGRTSPCTDAIIAAGVRRVVVGPIDPDPRMRGRGVDQLRAAGIDVVTGVLADEGKAVNSAYFKRVEQTLPWVTLKVAMTLDGRIATRTGHSKWITSEASRLQVHRMRAHHDAVLVGTGTLLADDPRLTCRLPDTDPVNPRQPLRVVLDRRLRAPLDRAVFRDLDRAATVVATAKARVDDARARLPKDLEVVGVNERGERLDIRGLLELLVEAHEVTTVLCEGGGELAASLLEDDLVDELVAYLAPRIVGGRDAPGPIGGLGRARMDDALALGFTAVEQVGPDVRIVARPRRRHDDEH